MSTDVKAMVAFVALLLSTSIVAAQGKPSVPRTAKKGYTWTEVAGWPDFTTGYWSGAGGGVATPGGIAVPGSRGNVPYTEDFRKQAEAQRAARGKGIGSCEPMGLIADSGSAFYFSKDVIVVGGLSDWYNVWRRVYMDGREHPTDVEPSYFGHSIGHWEGGTLVIDTVAIRAEAQVTQGVAVGNYDTHVIERFRLVAPDTMELVKTIINPQMLKEPWTTTRTLSRSRNEYLETYCWQDRESSEEVNLNL